MTEHIASIADRILERARQKNADPEKLAEIAEQVRDAYMDEPSDLNAADYVMTSTLADKAVIENADK